MCMYVLYDDVHFWYSDAMYPCSTSFTWWRSKLSSHGTLFESCTIVVRIVTEYISTPQASRLSFPSISFTCTCCQWTNAQRRVHLASCYTSRISLLPSFIVSYSATGIRGTYSRCFGWVMIQKRPLQLSQYDVWVHVWNINTMLLCLVCKNKDYNSQLIQIHRYSTPLFE